MYCNLKCCKHVFKHTEGEIYRKGWEWTNCAYGLSHLGAIKKEARALGVGAGREPIIFWLAENIKEVIATDLYGNETWTINDGAEAPGDIVQDAAKNCPIKTRVTTFVGSFLLLSLSVGLKLPQKQFARWGASQSIKVSFV